MSADAEHLGDNYPRPVDSFGRPIAGSQDFTITRNIDGQITPDSDGEWSDADRESADNRFHP